MIEFNIFKDNEEIITYSIIDNLLKANNRSNLIDSEFAIEILYDTVNSIIRDINMIIADNQINKLYDEETYISIGTNIMFLVYGISLPLKHKSYLIVNKIIKKTYIDYIQEFIENEKKFDSLLRVSDIFDDLELVEYSKIINKFEKNILRVDNYNGEFKNEIATDLEENSIVYNTIVEQLPDSVIIEYNKEILFANKAAADILGVKSVKELIGKKMSDYLILTENDEGLIQQQNDILYRNGSINSVERKYIRRSDNKVIFIETNHMIMSYKDKRAELKISRDISQRKKIENLKESIKQKTLQLEQSRRDDNLKTEFFANISHELRTPLNLILGIVQILEKYDLTEVDIEEFNQKWMKYRGILKQNCYRLVRLVNNIIDITKIDAGYMKLNLGKYNVVNVIEDITLSVAEYVESKHMNLIFDTDVEEKYMLIDPNLVERIMLNLLSNAIKFTNIGDEIKVTLKDLDDRMIISVKDTGIGIPKDKQDTIFKRFAQVDKSLSRNAEGSGIGLSMVKAFVEMHNGTIYLNSEYGEGSEFIIEMPVLNRDIDSEVVEIYEDKYSKVEKIKIEFSDIYSN